MSCSEEIDSLKKRCQLLTNEVNAKKTEVGRLESTNATMKDELDTLRQKCETNQKEIANLKDTIQNMPAEKELVEKRRTIAQVRD